jgi:hypothetical protein
MLSLFVLLVAAVPAQSEQRPKCKVSGRTLAANRTARAFDAYDRDGMHFVYGCLMSSRRVRVLGFSLVFNASGGSDLTLGALRGRWVATVSQFNGRDTGLTVHDLRTGRKRFASSSGDIDAVGITRSGSAAWTERTADTVRVVAVTATGSLTIDDLAGIEHGSLAVIGNRLFWMRDGQPHSVLLR